jgi:hypothetical protein
MNLEEWLKKHPERVEIEGFLKEVEPEIREDERERLIKEIGGIDED